MRGGLASWLAAAWLALGPLTASGAGTCPTGVTHAGTSADDVLDGTARGDRIAGNGGQDLLRGHDGDDCLNGGSYDDALFGGANDDQLVGEGGNDLLDGGEGDDDLIGGSNHDTLRGGEGVDRVFGEGGDDRLMVEAGDVPAGGTERLDGDSGFDTVVLGFDPGPVVPPDFDVTDPVTGGSYQVRGVEAVEVTPAAGLPCGNGALDPGEECDDGNQVAADGCDPNCRTSRCGNAFPASGEECDDGNTASGDGCSVACRLECGDGVAGTDEECDDGNRLDGDGCSARCRHECVEGCADGDPCTVDRCVAGTCVHEPLPPIDEAICAAGELLRLSECGGGPARLRLAARVTRLQRLLWQAKLGRRPYRKLVRATRVLDRARAAAAHARLSATCAAVLRPRLDALTTMIGGLHTTR